MGVSKLHGRAARAAVAAALTGAMAFGGLLAPATAAFALTPSTSTKVKITATDGTTFAGYNLFKADVDANGKATNVEWGDKVIVNGANKLLAIIDAKAEGAQEGPYTAWLKEMGYLYTGMTKAQQAEQYNSASNALAYIVENIDGSNYTTRDFGEGTGKRKVTLANTFANDLSKAIVDAELTPETTEVASGVQKDDLQEGYWLFLPYVGTTTQKDATPIWLFTTDAKEVVEATKKTIPSTLTKRVEEDNSGLVTFVDAGKGENVKFVLTATLKDGADKEAYVITDELPAGMSLAGGTVANPVAGVEVHKGDADGELVSATVTATANEETGGTTLKIEGASTAADDAYTVIYRATINDAAKIGLGDGTNDNSAVLTYVNDTTSKQVAGVATYEIELDQIDNETGIAINGAEYTIKLDDEYIQADGSLSSLPYTFKAQNGKINAPRIDSGTYTITEVTPPKGHDKISAANQTFTLKINNAVDSDTGEAKALVSADALTGAGTEISAEGDAATGKVTVTIGNSRTMILPITGMTPNQLGTIMGAALVAVGAIAIAMRRRNAAE